MWKIQNEEGLVLVDNVRRMRPIEANDAVIGILTLEQVVSLFESESDALEYIADHNLVGCLAIEQTA